MGINAQTSVPKFTIGDVLTAANTNLLTNAPPVFSGTATRDAAFGGAGEKTLAEGQLCYLEDSDTVQYYSGSAWQGVGGKVLQVVQATTSTAVTTTSTSFVTSGLSASITPSSATSKVLIMTIQMSKQVNTSSTQFVTLFRGTVAGTNLATGAVVSFGLQAVVSSEVYNMIPMQFLDSPNTTSATTYTSGFKVDSGTATINFAGVTSVMILMEIAA